MIFLPVIYFLITLIKAISTLLKAAQWYRRRVHEHNVKGVWWEKLCGVHAPSGHTPMHDAPAQPRGAAGLGTALTIAGVKVLERQFWARIIKEDFTVQREHHGVLCHVNHTPYNVAGLPRAAIVLIALVPSLGLGQESHWSQRKTEELHPPHTHTLLWTHSGPSHYPKRRKEEPQPASTPVRCEAPREEVSENSKSYINFVRYWLEKNTNAISWFSVYSTYFLLKEKLCF